MSQNQLQNSQTLSESNVWNALETHRKRLEQTSIKELFEQDNTRFQRFSLKYQGLLIDFSKNLITNETIELLVALAKQQQVELARDRLFTGETLNTTENRPALHTALRDRSPGNIPYINPKTLSEVEDTLKKMAHISKNIRERKHLSLTGKPIEYIVNIGIGGSDLGPRLVYSALKNTVENVIQTKFVSNVDVSSLYSALEEIDIERSIFIISSKSFGTQETILNANTLKDVIKTKNYGQDFIDHHFFAVTNNVEAALTLGINESNILNVNESTGGRFSIWSSVGLSIAISLGFEAFEDLLFGAHTMDNHFKQAPLEGNLPVLLALIGIWHRNFCNLPTYAVVPYCEELKLLPDYLQQLDMESNGKSTDLNDLPINYKTGPCLLGGLGTNSQHSFFQLLHQGSNIIPCDFIAAVEPSYSNEKHHSVLLANMLAQSKALMEGKTDNTLPNHRQFQGNRPSNTIVLDKVDAFHLGMLIALYEHKIFVQGIIWNINSFDQFGVELGKTMADALLELMSENKSEDMIIDSSSKGLLEHIKTQKINLLNQ